jgi:hypothetical protein
VHEPLQTHVLVHQANAAGLANSMITHQSTAPTHHLPGPAGPLPPSWGALSKLRMCYLYRNNLTGPLPGAWSGMTAMEDLDMSMSGLTGGGQGAEARRGGGVGRRGVWETRQSSSHPCCNSHSLLTSHGGNQPCWYCCWVVVQACKQIMGVGLTPVFGQAVAL